MKVLIACEESQEVCKAFRELGHEAFSCDIQECSGGHPEWHIMQDAVPLLNGNCTFTTRDGMQHKIEGKWDLLIAHPPCTYLTGAGACNIPKHPERIGLGFEAADFFLKILNADCDKVVVENPPPMKRFGLPNYSQLVRPWMFGESNNKPICLWVKGVDKLEPTKIVEKDKDIVRSGIPDARDAVVSSNPQAICPTTECRGAASRDSQGTCVSNGVRNSRAFGCRISGFPAQISPWCKKLKIDKVKTPLFGRARHDGQGQKYRGIFGDRCR